METRDALGAALGIGSEAVYVVDVDGIDEAMRMQAPQSFEVVIIEQDVVGLLDAARRRLLVHNVVAHLPPGGLLLTPCSTTTETIGADADATGMTRSDSIAGHHGWRREDRRNVHDLLADARRRIRRWSAAELHTAQRSAVESTESVGPLVLDIRTPTDRDRDGIIPGSIHVPRTVLEWRVDPASGYSLVEIRSFDHPLVIVCTGGYSSSLAAADLLDLGFSAAGDLAGGVDDWRRSGLPLISPTSHFTEESL